MKKSPAQGRTFWEEVERLQNIKTGWTFRAYGVVVHPDGIIEWDYSTGGYFA